MDCIAHIERCTVCKRPMVISRVLIGVDHTMGTQVTCLECLPADKREEVEQRYARPAYVPQTKDPDAP
jgi:hypothetical protein